MDLSATYCPMRRDLEERGWWLTSRLSSLTGRLLDLVGQDHAAFVSMKDECRETRAAITESHRGLAAHRRDHGC